MAIIRMIETAASPYSFVARPHSRDRQCALRYVPRNLKSGHQPIKTTRVVCLVWVSGDACYCGPCGGGGGGGAFHEYGRWIG